MTERPDTAPASPRRTLLLNLLLSVVAIAFSLALLDLLLVLTGLFPPSHSYGDQRVGWLPAAPTGAMTTEKCWDPGLRRVWEFERNEMGLRTSIPVATLRDDTTLLRVAVSGDSHTELCMPNDSTHFGATARALQAAGVPAAAFAYGAGKYSPLQAYLAIKPALDTIAPEAFILNLYSGNDVYDMLRIDDRPHLVPDGDGYRMAEPVWYQEDPPGLRRRSRVLYALRQLSEITGLRRMYVRVRYLRDVAREQGQGYGEVFGYMNDLRLATVKEAGYPQAYSAQMLNQQLFFRRFPGSQDEAMRRVEALLAMVRAAHPGIALILSPVPSYQLVQGTPRDTTMVRVFERLATSFEAGVAQEQALFDGLRAAAQRRGWTFIDNLAPLRSHADPAALYNDFDFHVSPLANRIIGETQADTLRSLRARGLLRP